VAFVPLVERRQVHQVEAGGGVDEGGIALHGQGRLGRLGDARGGEARRPLALGFDRPVEAIPLRYDRRLGVALAEIGVARRDLVEPRVDVEREQQSRFCGAPGEGVIGRRRNEVVVDGDTVEARARRADVVEGVGEQQEMLEVAAHPPADLLELPRVHVVGCVVAHGALHAEAVDVVGGQDRPESLEHGRHPAAPARILEQQQRVPAPLLTVAAEQVQHVVGEAVSVIVGVRLQVEGDLEAVIAHDVEDERDQLVLAGVPSPPAQVDGAHAALHDPARVLFDDGAVGRVVGAEPRQVVGGDVVGRLAAPLVPVEPGGSPVPGVVLEHEALLEVAEAPRRRRSAGDRPQTRGGVAGGAERVDRARLAGADGLRERRDPRRAPVGRGRGSGPAAGGEGRRRPQAGAQEDAAIRHHRRIAR